MQAECASLRGLLHDMQRQLQETQAQLVEAQLAAGECSGLQQQLSGVQEQLQEVQGQLAGGQSNESLRQELALSDANTAGLAMERSQLQHEVGAVMHYAELGCSAFPARMMQQ